MNVRDCLGYNVSESDVLLLIDTWLNDKMKAYEVDIVTNGADYNKIERMGWRKGQLCMRWRVIWIIQ